MSTSRSGVKIDVYLHGNCCFSYCQHTEALITDLATQRKMDINFGDENNATIYPTDSPTEVEQAAKDGDVRSVTLYSSKSFDEFTKEFKNNFGDRDDYNFCLKNCADAVKFAINFFCPEKCGVTAFCSTYKIACCWGFFGTLGMNCFPSVFCTTPSDTFDLAQILSCTGYGHELTAINDPKQPLLPLAGEIESKMAASDSVSASIVASSSTGPAMYQPAAASSQIVITTPAAAAIEPVRSSLTAQ